MDGNADSGTESFGALLRDYRGGKGVTQEELAREQGSMCKRSANSSWAPSGGRVVPRSSSLADALKLDAQERATFIAMARRGQIPEKPLEIRECGDGLTQVVLRAGDFLRHVDERFAGDYALVAEAG